MKQFFTKNTVEADCWCKPCGKRTRWKIGGGRPQYCLECMIKLEDQHEKSKAETEPPKQEGLF